MSDRIRPADTLVSAYNVVLLAVWIRLADAAWYAPWIAGAHGAGALLPLVLGRGRARAGIGLLREIYPLLCLIGFWTELGAVQALAPGTTYDGSIAMLDLALFGRHLNLVWMPAMPYPVFSELMHFFYFTYYPLIFLPPIAMWAAGRAAELRDMTLRLMVTYLACYLVYLAFPVIGPAELLPHYQGPLTDGLFYGLTHAARAAGDSLGTAFPSSHVAGATTVAVMAWRWLSRPVAVLVTIQALGVFLATVYTQNHYPVDAIAGLLAALGLQLVIVPAASARYAAPRVPVLPARAPSLPDAITGATS
ncbi:MAG TPA: phosphatase PAP2 family protein [Gemmatimonadales bacterium]|nr:phosphatase PAP2 family protein [Gemmatimonadales bacterium]